MENNNKTDQKTVTVIKDLVPPIVGGGDARREIKGFTVVEEDKVAGTVTVEKTGYIGQTVVPADHVKVDA